MPDKRMEISYATHEQMYAGIRELVYLCIAFVADHDELRIRLTGEFI
jgi:protoheme ferro-lyase